ncbi:hypothetical protein VOLCADRAFT_99812 [Volvox carteri f. nagariensis]|uniref:Uncharacterized protein jtnpA1 n=1 Tax=Volvox carteri f. nagariensis TaxID=3068 RepID=D8UIQ3_VOLCA|nr:uncharacterized protein VOLCADRAFT_99812 [Volvox carteri f. nagariensis]EFJ40395.1 hypothetical protein VOLCADRAFT_99812 [Volvox carteri f. nagariensis]|eukprot:XP_002958546.1 hypothetical protein VOLCADRAFT_99812 [Volvox carteri f. nagariensis]
MFCLKTHTMFLLAGPIGYYAIAAARLPATLEGVYLDLLQACGDLWDKAITREELSGLRERVASAICGVERHLSAVELDIKLHNLLHLVDGIEMFGPLFAWAMFQPESIWGMLSRLAHSKVYMESSMFFSALDKEVTLKLRQSPEYAVLGRRDGDEDEVDPGMWDPETYLCEGLPVIRLGNIEEEMYRLGPTELEGLELLYQRYNKEGRVHSRCKIMKEIWVGEMKLQKGSWFLVRPDAEGDGLMWFGVVKALIRHKGPDRAIYEVVRADWFRGPSLQAQVDRRLRCPVVRSKPIKIPDGEWWFANAIVPWPCWAMPHPSKPSSAGLKVVLARHWHVTRFLSPYPRI